MSADDALVTRALYDSPLFQGVDRDHLALLQKITTTLTVPAGAPIFLLGEDAASLYVIASGRVALQLPVVIRGKGADVTIEEKHAGDVIAWSALVSPHKLTLTARAIEETSLVALRRDDLRALFEEHAAIHQRIADNLCHVISSRVSLLEALLMRDLQRWVAERYG
jgi:CRP/FNR family transcriptional regulator, nitrogen oxide reductase regulator